MLKSNNISVKSYLIFALTWIVFIPLYELGVCKIDTMLPDRHIFLLLFFLLVFLLPTCAIVRLVFWNKFGWSMAKQWGMLSVYFLLLPLVPVIIRCIPGIPDMEFHPESGAGMDYFFEMVKYLAGVLVGDSQILRALVVWIIYQPVICLLVFLFLHLFRRLLLFLRLIDKRPSEVAESEGAFQTLGWILSGILPFGWLIIAIEIIARSGH